MTGTNAFFFDAPTLTGFARAAYYLGFPNAALLYTALPLVLALLAFTLVGDDNFLWDTDYPHPDGTFPWGIGAMLEQPIPDSSRRKILWDNAARAFGLN